MTHILIIDDSPTEVHVFRTILEKHEIQVSAAVDGDDGIEKALKFKPDCILMDMGNASGRERLHRKTCQ